MFEQFLGWLSINLIQLGLRLMPYPEVELAIRASIERGIAEFRDTDVG